MILASLLSSSSFIITNKILIKAVGTDAAILLGELCSEYNYWENRNELSDGEWFYSTRENIEENTGLTEHKQRMALNKLIQLNLVETKKKGIPCKIYYKLNEDEIIECYSNTQKKSLKVPKNSVVEIIDNKNLKNETSCNDNLEQQDVEKLDINNNNKKNNKNNNENHIQASPSPEEKIEYAIKVKMTENEYNDLVKTYGEFNAHQLVEQLSLYKQAHGKGYESDYAAIKIWVTKRLKEMEMEDAKYKKFKNGQNSKENKRYSFEQREYPSGFFESLYANIN